MFDNYIAKSRKNELILGKIFRIYSIVYMQTFQS